MIKMFQPKFLALGLSVACLVGCGGGSSDDPDLAGVSGIVTLDGTPLPDASVIFTPAGGGRPAYGMTDESGEYTLEYSSSNSGTPPGDYVVAIRTFQEPQEDIDTGEMKPGVPEKVPTAYNSPSTLKVTVPSDNYDFELKSDAGEVVQPELLDDPNEF